MGIFVQEKMDLPLFPRNMQYNFVDKAQYHTTDADAEEVESPDPSGFSTANSLSVSSPSTTINPLMKSPSQKKTTQSRSASTPPKLRREAYSCPMIMPGTGAGKRDA